MGNVDRVSLTVNQKTVLLTQVEYRCPNCQAKLQIKRNDKIYNRFEIAHIYPHSPTPQEEKLLKDVERLSDDPESLDNLIPLCNNCHEDFDNPRTLEGYQRMLLLKKQASRDQKMKSIYSSEIVEKEIIQIAQALASCSEGDLEELSYNVLTVDEKLKNSKSAVFRNKIKNNVVQYFSVVRQQFREIDNKTPGQSDVIASQIKAFYAKAAQIEKDEEPIFRYLVEWMSKRTGSTQNAALEIVVSFFIQDCEVFPVAAKQSSFSI